MRFDRRLIPWLAGNEGFVSRWYKDPTGIPTIGFGFTWASAVFRDWWMEKHGRKFRPGDTISKPDAITLLAILIEHEYAPPVAGVLDRKSPSVTTHAAAAAIDMVYNCGAGALRWKWCAALLRGDIAEAARLFRITGTTAAGRKLPGLVRRRAEGADILQINAWPDWVKSPDDISPSAQIEALPGWLIDNEEFQQGLGWLQTLGFYQGPLPGTRGHKTTKAAVLAFQKQHPQLGNDAVLGRATYEQLQRVIDLRAKATKGGTTAGTGAAVGAGDSAVSGTGYGEWIMWGALAVAIIGAAWLAWTYRDELKAAWLSVSGRARKTVWRG